MMARSTGMVPTSPFMDEKPTAAKSVMPATSVPKGLKLSPEELSAMLTAVAERPMPMTMMMEAMSTGGRMRSIHAVPASLMIPATARNTRPAQTMPDRAASRPWVAPTATTGLMKAKELPR